MKKLLMAGVTLCALAAASATHAKTLQEWYGIEESPPAPVAHTNAGCTPPPPWWLYENLHSQWCKALAAERQERAEAQARDDAAGPEAHARTCQDLINNALNPIGNSTLPPGYIIKSQFEKDLLLKDALAVCERYNAIDRTLGKIK